MNLGADEELRTWGRGGEKRESSGRERNGQVSGTETGFELLTSTITVSKPPS